MEREDPRFTAALVSSSNGQWGETIRLCSEVLAVDPFHLGAGNLLASALHMLRSERDDDTRFRLLSVLFVDVGGSTRLTTLLGPERWRQHLLAIQSVVARSVAHFEGYIHNYEGDAVLCSFSFPRSHEDDARRAVLCGLAIVADVGEVSLRINADCLEAGSQDQFSVRVGIDTGRVVVGPSGSMPSVNAADLVGDAVNFAARLQHRATRTGVVISDRTLAFVRGYFHTEPEGPVDLRGFAPQVIHHVLRSTEAEDRLQATSHRTPLIGRHDDVTGLEAAWSRAVAGGQASILLRGDAGVGKSRLAEFVVDLAHATGRPVVELRCSSLMRATPFGAIGAMLHRFLGLESAAGPPTIDIIGARLRATIGDIPEWMPSIIGRLIGVGVDQPALELPDELRARSFEALIELFAAAVGTGPVLLLVEDVHEADPSTLEFLTRLLAIDSLTGYLLLMTSRHDLDGLLSPFEAMEIGPLSSSETSELISQLLGDGDPAAVARIAERCDGVPLYAEELCLRGQPDGSAVPDTLEAVLMSRLDTLDGDSLAVAEAMAVVAAEVADDAIGELVDLEAGRLESALGHLLAERVVIAVASANQPTYRFRHALVQTVAYDRILQSARLAAHARWATLLIHRAEAGEPVRPELIAEHHLAAGAPIEALVWWKYAGEQAAASAAHNEAADHFQRALDIVRASEPGPLRDSQEFELSLQLGFSRSASQGYASALAFEAFRRAQELTSDLPRTPALIPAVWGLWSFHLIRGDLRTAADPCRRQCGALGAR